MHPFTFFLLFISLVQVFSLQGYVTYHLYNPSFPLTSCACSDGAHGLITRWGYQDLSSLYPFVTAFSLSPWNSPYCGDCIKLNYGSNTIYVTVIDLCGSVGGFDAHFDISPDAFQLLVGSTEAGHVNVGWDYASSNLCKGNRG